MPETSQPPLSSADRARGQVSSPPMGRVGRWELVRLIGQGTLTNVYQARLASSRVEQPAGYAVKVLRPEWEHDPRGLAALAREAHAGRNVSSPHLLPILAGQLSEPPYHLAMPCLEGATLAEQLYRQTAIDLPVAFWNARQVAEALGALHAGGWTHSDVKPSNIFVSHTGHVTLLDLGFAQHDSEQINAANLSIRGTMNYMAPEVNTAFHECTAKSDIYSLGVTLFELLTGRLPFDAADIAELVEQHRQQVPADVRSLVPYLPKRAARLVQQMLAKEPLRRPTARDVIHRLAVLEIETFAERGAAA